MDAIYKKQLSKLGKTALITIIEEKTEKVDELSYKCRECRNECPLPVCDLPELLSPKQMRMAMVYLDMPYKQMTVDLNMSATAVSSGMHEPKRLPTNNKKVSDYLKKKLIEKAIL